MFAMPPVAISRTTLKRSDRTSGMGSPAALSRLAVMSSALLTGHRRGGNAAAPFRHFVGFFRARNGIPHARARLGMHCPADPRAGLPASARLVEVCCKIEPQKPSARQLGVVQAF